MLSREEWNRAEHEDVNWLPWHQGTTQRKQHRASRDDEIGRQPADSVSVSDSEQFLFSRLEKSLIFLT